MLVRFVDPVLPYMVYGDLTQEQSMEVKRLRRRLLDLPSEIQAKIDSGELESVLKYRFSEWEILGIPDPFVRLEANPVSVDDSGEQ